MTLLRSTPEAGNSALNPNPNPETLQLAQLLTEQLTITAGTWHRLKSNRKARALEQAAAAIVFLLKDQPQEAQARLQQAVGWLDHSVSAPPCPTHGSKAKADRASKASITPDS